MPMGYALEDMMKEIRKDINTIKAQQTEILVALSEKPCKLHADRIKLLQKIIFTLVGVLCLTVIGALVYPIKAKVQKASASPLVQEQVEDATAKYRNSSKG